MTRIKFMMFSTAPYPNRGSQARGMTEGGRGVGSGTIPMLCRSWAGCRDGNDGYVDECSGYCGVFWVRIDLQSQGYGIILSTGYSKDF